MKTSTLIALAMLALNTAMAADASPTLAAPVSATGTVSTWIYPSRTLLPIVVDKAEGERKLEARLVNLQNAGVDLGLEKLIIEGDATATDADNGGKDYAISWGMASLRRKDGTKVSTYIGKPLQSTVSANPAVKGGDSFTAEGDPNELLDAWKRLQEMMAQDDRQEKQADEKKTEAPTPTKDFGASAMQSDQPQLRQQSPQFQVKAEPVITSTREGCNMNVDFGQMVAIVQERTLQDGKEVAACQDTLTRFPLEKKYSGCPLKVDADQGKVYEQYTLSYVDPNSGGAIQVAECQPDTDKSIAISTDTASCGLRHDFAKGVSYQRAKKTYVDPQGNIQTIQDCEDTDVTFQQESTYDGCEDIIDIPGMKAVHQKRVRITKDGEFQYITECAPDTGDYAELKAEACTGANRYTHDFGGGQSFLNQTIYYTDKGGNRKDVQTCQPGTTTFQHKKDETACAASNDDIKLESTMFAKTYIEDSDLQATPIFISECAALAEKVPYIAQDGVWQRTNTLGNAAISYAGSLNEDWVKTTSDATMNRPYRQNGDGGAYVIESVWAGKLPSISGNPPNQKWELYYTTWNSLPTVMMNLNLRMVGKQWCLLNNQTPTQGSILIDGQEVDISNSTASPVNTLIEFRYNKGSTANNGTFNLNCTSVCPIATYGEKYPAYLRGDGTTYVKKDVTLAKKVVCGDVSTFDGVNP